MTRSFPIVFVAFLLILSSAIIMSEEFDGSAADSIYRTPDSAYTYSTHGSGSASSPYYSILSGVESTMDTLFVPSALEGYGLTTIESMGRCLSKTIVVPRTVTGISESAFEDCERLEHLVFLGDRPDWSAPHGVSVSVLSNSSGWNANEVETLQVMSANGGASYFVLDGAAVVIGGSGIDITVPDEDDSGHPFTTIASESFRDSDILSVQMGRNIVCIGTRAFYGCTELRSASIPESIERIEDEAFRYCVSLGDVNLHGVSELGFESFRDCRSFESLTIPDSVVFIGDGAFYVCRGLASVDVGPLEVIPARTFGYCSSLVSVDLSGVTDIGYSAFNTCRVLETVLFGNPESIGGRAFFGCESLENFDLGGSLVSIGNEAFSGCLSITEIRFPESFGSLGDDVFFHANSLEDVYFEGDMPDMPDEPFSGLSDIKIHVERSHAGTWDSYDGDIIIEGDGAEDGMTCIVLFVAIAAVLLMVAIIIVIRRRMVR